MEQILPSTSATGCLPVALFGCPQEPLVTSAYEGTAEACSVSADVVCNRTAKIRWYCDDVCCAGTNCPRSPVQRAGRDLRVSPLCVDPNQCAEQITLAFIRARSLTQSPSPPQAAYWAVLSGTARPHQCSVEKGYCTVSSNWPVRFVELTHGFLWQPGTLDGSPHWTLVFSKRSSFASWFEKFTGTSCVVPERASWPKATSRISSSALRTPTRYASPRRASSRQILPVQASQVGCRL